jgi:hypothetical protein
MLHDARHLYLASLHGWHLSTQTTSSILHRLYLDDILPVAFQAVLERAYVHVSHHHDTSVCRTCCATCMHAQSSCPSLPIQAAKHQTGATSAPTMRAHGPCCPRRPSATPRQLPRSCSAATAASRRSPLLSPTSIWAAASETPQLPSNHPPAQPVMAR